MWNGMVSGTVGRGDGLLISGAARFLLTLSPGIRVTLQYDDRPPSIGVFQGFQDGTVLLTNFDGFAGLVRIAVNRINAVSVF